MASALLQQKQVNAASIPQTNFDSSFDYDPILSKIQALASQTVNNATTNAAQLRKDALISSGLTSVGKDLNFDENTLTAAGQNPESEYAQLQREFAARQKQLEEAMSAQNLLYSGEYANNLSLLNQGRASAEGGIGSRLRDMLAGIDTGLLTSKETARQQELDAATQAALQRAGYESMPNGSVVDSSGLEWDAGSASALASAGYSGDAVSAAAQQYAANHGFSVHGVKQEGHIEYHGNQAGVWIKYDTPSGSSTEWTPLGPPDMAAPTPPPVDTTPAPSDIPSTPLAAALTPIKSPDVLRYAVGGAGRV